MATITVVEQPTGFVGCHVYKATAVGGTDDTQAIPSQNFPDKTVHVYGTLGGGTVTIQGSNDVSGTIDWETLHDPGLNNLTFVGSGIKQILENPFQIRALVTGGTGSSITVEFALSTSARR